MLSCSFSTSYSLRIYVHVDNEVTANLSTVEPHYNEVLGTMKITLPLIRNDKPTNTFMKALKVKTVQL